MSPNSALFRLFTQSDGQCRAICEDTPDCRWVSGQQHIMCSDQAKGHCCTPDHINTKRHFFWTFFYRFYYWYPIDYSPSPLYCYLFRRSVLTNIKVPDNICVPPSLSLASKEGGEPTSIDRNHNTVTSSLLHL